MKKYLLLYAACILSICAGAQENKIRTQYKQEILLLAGPSFPVLDFSSTDKSNQAAGFAKTGYNLNFQYKYHFTEHLGLRAGIVYARYTVNHSNHSVFPADASADHWQYYGLKAGPELSFPIGNGYIDWNILSGIVNANAPELVKNGITQMPGQWKYAKPIETGLSLRLLPGHNIILSGGIGFIHIKPYFNFSAADETVKFSQCFNTINVNIGAGIRF